MASGICQVKAVWSGRYCSRNTVTGQVPDIKRQRYGTREPSGKHRQPPFFDPEATDAVNYGAMGIAIAHDLTHAIDAAGAAIEVRFGDLRRR